MIGSASGISNDEPIVGAYGVNAEGSGDMYPKGGNMLHTIRQIVGDDATVAGDPARAATRPSGTRS